MSESLCGEHTIVLDRSRNARAFNLEGESFWCDELGRILVKVGEHVESLKFTKSQERWWGSREECERHRGDGDERPYLSIAVFGPSGSGKSSLLKTLVREVNEKRGDELIRKTGAPHLEEGATKGRIYALPVMYPERFARHDHFLYAFLANALKEEKEVRDRRRKQRQDQEGRDRRDLEPSALSPVQQAFQELSEFLRVIDEPEKGQEFDPLGLSLERLERHTSGLLLREKIGAFIDSLANALAGSSEDSVVLLTVDDADMSPEHLVTTLRTYQSYLLHPRLVPVFTFTDRTAEEILRVHFRKHLAQVGSRDADEARTVYEEPGEGTQRLRVETQLALQYLARCFPVRNRVRLGPAPARLRSARYETRPSAKREREPDDDNGSAQERQVLQLLERSSRLLFGCPDRDFEHEIRTLLRPATLRRQLHVVDEMVEAGVERLYRKPTPDRPLRWVTVFNRAAWSLMNVHRDVLREFDLHLEDLYSWSPQGLQRVILDTLLDQDLEVRRALLRRWRRRTDSRRGQTLSLLAANVFRPWIPGDEPSGDQGYVPRYEPRNLIEGTVGEQRVKIPEGKEGISAATGLIWFLRLVIGFYNPQLLAWNRPNDVAQERPEKGRVVGVGWDLANGPINAIRAAASDEAMASSGMIFLEPRTFADALRENDWLEGWGPLMKWYEHEEWERRRKLASWAFKLRLATDEASLDATTDHQRLFNDVERVFQRLGYDRVPKGAYSELLKLSRRRTDLGLSGALELLELYHQVQRVDNGDCVQARDPLAAVDSTGSGGSLQEGPTGEVGDPNGEEVPEESEAPKPNGDDGSGAEGNPDPEAEQDSASEVANPWREWAREIVRSVRTWQQIVQKIEEPGEQPGWEERKKRIESRLSRNVFLLRCWGFYGYNRNRYWAAVSFWRGLGLIGRLLEARRREQLEVERQYPGGSAPPELLQKRVEKWKETVQGILRTHLVRGMVPAEFLGEEAGTEGLNLAFQRWDLVREQLDLNKKDTVGADVFRWLNGLGRSSEGAAPEEASLPVPYTAEGSEPHRIPMHRTESCRWSRSFLRRLHGDDVVGSFLPQLSAAYLEDQGRYIAGNASNTGYRWNAGVAMTTWTRLLLDYWRGVFPMQQLLRTCPLLAPFTNGPLVDDLREANLKSSYLELMGREERAFAWERVDWEMDPVSGDPELDKILDEFKQDACREEDQSDVLSFGKKQLGLPPERKQDEEGKEQQIGSLNDLSDEDRENLFQILRTQAEYADRYAAAVHLFHQIPRAHRRHGSGA